MEPAAPGQARGAEIRVAELASAELAVIVDEGPDLAAVEKSTVRRAAIDRVPGLTQIRTGERQLTHGASERLSSVVWLSHEHAHGPRRRVQNGFVRAASEDRNAGGV